MYLLLKRLIKIECLKTFSIVVFLLSKPLICLHRIDISDVSVGTCDTYRIVSDQTICRSNIYIYNYIESERDRQRGGREGGAPPVRGVGVCCRDAPLLP